MNNDTQELYHRGTTLFCTGRYAEAIEVFERALEHDPLGKEVLVALAASVDRLGLFYEAVLCCERALTVDNQFADALFVKGVALFKLSQYRDAVGCFERIVNKDSTHAEAWFMKGNCHYQLGELQEAISVMTRPWESAKNTQKHFTTWPFPWEKRDSMMRQYNFTTSVSP